MADDFFTLARGRLMQLKALHDAGALDTATYENERRAVEREIGNHLADAAPAEGKARPSLRLMAGLGAAVLAIAVAGYWWTGSPSLVGAGASVAAAPPAAAEAGGAAASDAAANGLHEIAGMVDKLAARLKDRPDDAQGWAMLARSYTVLGRFADAVPAYARASDLQPKNADLLADYADAVAATKGTANNPESTALVERALAIDPGHPKALALDGTALYDRGDYAGAVARWQKIADRLPPESDLAKQVNSSIVEARERASASGQPIAATAAPAAVPAAPAAVAAAPAATLTGTVTLDPALAAKASPGDSVFVFARAAGGGRMPLAVQRAKVGDLPLAFKLDDGMAMAAGATISSAKQVIVGARISKTGNALPQAGDLWGETTPIAPGASGVAIRIDKVVAGP
jgi:cytochrome c-type biogenesis protein CcmH